METKKSDLKIVVAEFTKKEHDALMQLLVLNLSHNQEALTHLRYMPTPECNCGKVECVSEKEFETEKARSIEALERGVAILAEVTRKLS